MTGINKRRLERFRLEIPANLLMMNRDESQSFQFLTGNICSGGAFLYTNQKIPIGTEINVELVIPVRKLKRINADNVLIKVNGAVIRNEENGIAVCFDNNYKITPMQS